MRQIFNVLERYQIKPKKYVMKGKATLIETSEGRFAIKEKNRSENGKILQYLNSRNFDYYPKVKIEDDSYEIREYIEDINMPRDQKIADLIDLVSLLHNKTTYYKEVDEDDYKIIFEDIKNNIAYLTEYYNDIISIIETKVFMSPSEYLFARNVSKIYSCLHYCDVELDHWYDLMKEKRKQRVVVLHNNLSLDHFLRNQSSYLISWEKAKIGIPIFDLYKLYKRHGLEFEFGELLKQYERNYPLQKEERMLFFILISLPDKIEFTASEYKMCHIVSDFIDSLYKTEQLISPYYAEQGK